MVNPTASCETAGCTAGAVCCYMCTGKHGRHFLDMHIIRIWGHGNSCSAACSASTLLVPGVTVVWLECRI